MFGFKKIAMPTAAEALPGRDHPIRTAASHFVNHHALKGPYPEGSQKALFGLGCFWGAEKSFWQLGDGIYVTAVGYAGGLTPNPTYEEVCSGRTGHNEVVLVVYDPKKISYDALLKTFWEGHDPTQGMRQGNDVGTQYRSGIYTFTPEQKASGRGVEGDVREGARQAKLRRHHHRDRRCAGVLFCRGLSPAIPRQESVRLLRAWRHRRVVPDRDRGQADAGRQRLISREEFRSHGRPRGRPLRLKGGKKPLLSRA